MQNSMKSVQCRRDGLWTVGVPCVLCKFMCSVATEGNGRYQGTPYWDSLIVNFDDILCRSFPVVCFTIEITPTECDAWGVCVHHHLKFQVVKLRIRERTLLVGGDCSDDILLSWLLLKETRAKISTTENPFMGGRLHILYLMFFAVNCSWSKTLRQ